MKVASGDIRTNKWGTVENNLDDVSYLRTLFITLESSIKYNSLYV